MNSIINHNLTREDAINIVHQAESHNSPNEGIRISAAYTIHEKELRFLIGRCAPARMTDSDLHHAYHDYLFISAVVKESTYSEIINKLHAGGLIIHESVPAIKASPNSNWTHAIIPSSHSLIGAPLQRFWISCEKQPIFKEGKLIKHGLPFCKSSTEYIREFLALDKFHGAQDSRTGSLILDTPETRGRIAMENDRVSISSNISDLCIVGQTANTPMIMITESESHSISPHELRDAELWLISKDDQIIDFISSSEMPLPNTQITETDYESLIMRGEHEGCEFKKYISLTHPKAEDLLKATCAMSNLRGGYIFIGVTDDAEICGIANHELNKDYKVDPAIALKTYEKEVQKMLREGLRDNQCFSTKAAEIFGMAILVINVTQSDGLNYTTQKKDAYIRRGASSTKMTPEEIRAHGKSHYLANSIGQW